MMGLTHTAVAIGRQAPAQTKLRFTQQEQIILGRGTAQTTLLRLPLPEAVQAVTLIAQAHRVITT